MALRDQPYLPLYVQDFLTDEKLAECSASATGVFIRIMCLMHKSESYGRILPRVLLQQNAKQSTEQSTEQTDQQNNCPASIFASKLVRHLPYSFEEIESAIEELLHYGVLTIEGGALSQKRMVRDYELSTKRAESGRRGGEAANRHPGSEDFATAKQVANIAANQVANIEANIPANTPANTEYEYENEIHNEVIDKKGIKRGKKEKKEKEDVAEFVSLTPTEKETLIASYGPEDTDEMILILNNYKGSTGKKYASDYLAIKSWVVDRLEEKKKFQTTNRQQLLQGSSRTATQPQSKISRIMNSVNQSING